MYSKKQIDTFKEIILDRIAKGDSLKKILETKYSIKENNITPLPDKHKEKEPIEMPGRTTVYTWFNDQHPDFDKLFLNNYTCARQDSADLDVEKMEEIVEDLREKKLDHNQARVMADILKWTAGRKKPKKYGDKLDVTSGGETMENVVLYLPDNGRRIEKEEK